MAFMKVVFDLKMAINQAFLFGEANQHSYSGLTKITAPVDVLELLNHTGTTVVDNTFKIATAVNF